MKLIKLNDQLSSQSEFFAPGACCIGSKVYNNTSTSTSTEPLDLGFLVVPFMHCAFSRRLWLQNRKLFDATQWVAFASGGSKQSRIGVELASFNVLLCLTHARSYVQICVRNPWPKACPEKMSIHMTPSCCSARKNTAIAHVEHQAFD
jgi:hypothetical protein